MKITFNWSSIDRTRQIQTKILIAISIDQETGSIDRKSGQNKTKQNKTKKQKQNKTKQKQKQIFEKHSNFMQKLHKAWYFMNSMHEYDMKWFSKTLILNTKIW